MPNDYVSKSFFGEKSHATFPQKMPVGRHLCYIWVASRHRLQSYFHFTHKHEDTSFIPKNSKYSIWYKGKDGLRSLAWWSHSIVPIRHHSALPSIVFLYFCIFVFLYFCIFLILYFFNSVFLYFVLTYMYFVYFCFGAPLGKCFSVFCLLV